MPLVFFPENGEFFWWAEDGRRAPLIDLLARSGSARDADVIVPKAKRARISGLAIGLRDALAPLSSVSAQELSEQLPSLASWCLASKLATDLVVRERVVPKLVSRGRGHEARWAAGLADPVDQANVTALARAMPPSSHAAPLAGDDKSTEVWSADASLRAFLDAAVDSLVRSAPKRPWVPELPRWEFRLFRALTDPDDACFEPNGFAERSLVEDLAAWSEPALGASNRPRTCFRLELPESAKRPFVVRFFLQSPDDPSLLVAASEIWSESGRRSSRLGQVFADPEESLLRSIALAARLFPPLGASLAGRAPTHAELDAKSAWTFLSEAGPALSEAGFGVIVPGELTARGQRRVRLRLRIGGSSTKTAGVVGGGAGLRLGALVEADWQVAIGDRTLTPSELAALAKQKAPLVQHRGAWVAVDPRELLEIQRRLSAEPRVGLAATSALAVALAGEIAVDGLALAAEVVVDGGFARALEALQRGQSAAPTRVPGSLRATLRPYQERGLAWLSTLAALGLGACLADDMGLGKTVQLLAFLLARRESLAADARPTLLVAPTSVLGNWEREIERFAPSLEVVRHYGSERAQALERLQAADAPVVLTSYGLLRRDAQILGAIDWAVVALDEAQNIKNSASATARAARSLRASHRFALTGTPVENRLAELWSIFEFANPGLLGPLEKFRREYAIPIERYASDSAASRLQKIAAPFLLRRIKSDPAVIRDLPAKNEMKVACLLTREQATLYRAVVDEELRRIAKSEGVERRGRVLALITFLKQICNHPAQYLGESGPLSGRSGKLMRVAEMLEEAVLAGDKALVFTQFREMGERLVQHLSLELETEVLFLHGGTKKSARDEMVRRFQEEPREPRIFVLSLKAGGTGLNLTAASHVFHYDRWWNPAVEDQATDRAYRIGQTRPVHVHKLFCAGTVEDKVDRMLEQKRELAAKIVRDGEHFITELGDDALRDLLALSSDARVTDETPAEGATLA